MKTQGAVITKAPGEYEVVDLELEDPRPDELQVQLVAAGLCHSDDHYATGDLHLGTYPTAGGHEGAGIVTKVGPNAKGIKEGDHVVFSFIPACGHCRWCTRGMQNLCDHGASIMAGPRWTDGSYRLHLPDGTNVGQVSGISTFVRHTTASLESAIKIDDDIPLDLACLTGCGVGTGWGSAVNSAEVRPGQTVVVMGIGGIGINAVQGARHAGASNIIAVDPVAFKREKAEQLGATHTCSSIEEAGELARQLTNGQGADAAIVTIGVLTGEAIAQAFATVRKAGITVVTAVGNHEAIGIPLPLNELTLYQKRLQGALYGGCGPNWDIKAQLQLYREGVLKLDELLTNRYKLEDITKGYDDLRDGKNIRGIIDYTL
ncbi:NDMA-dependent alcohol dehydrogenase [Pseudonocardia kujensis]|uniref:NDMA-dependent alcohol dehydrogenase n=1 Tax=Pseudonocardia kujensis TaxID=1128675 RepID=UPI001E2EFAB5|nr:NDMA-dependent alcohol dehydrogenase [Pseudonocardia kujensis]MCE0761892.1 NDMA-dependent alcohol dehydrogenase [Pseudonocardia kujensis]